jgi:IS30 family transposase
MKQYQRLSYEERVKIAKLWQGKTPVWQIAKALERPKSTISRELMVIAHKRVIIDPKAKPYVAVARKVF